MAKKKATGSVKNGRDSISKRLGIKKGNGSKVICGNIIVRQRGLKFKNGTNTKIGKDYTIYSMSKGKVFFVKSNIVCVI
ncbi:50S ribosomal protein L27 [Candidatus Vidania fulgoroideae]|uniref:Large ribosomal subunit protein bL27 n=1 Tax=Candidatus Vidania fulgoroideorum TaxID=881286 RepID=A0A974XAF1_9PROT|nr:50S ribosomal protein L27 [Candidatus Vidania fulgoroideae]